ncbi:type II toxin-antitoxin system mRNA interferase toxin, RelE/StbE family [Pseudomonas prosekii]|jgi:addiction module RelE/StbE family toxin|uniref:Type II toxin-antitoxin system mRNA interferase toxin, RelE/StbE family n=1 Tax=Pseudomonas prosekii TaxID=1148509 RepID=A0A3L8CYI9_9PSED|nr:MULTISPECIES: type II toxin-antitoxin system RelE/ParE family toxin [Pseudomonas]RLU04364.1 type II toxin-antitoxin system mRNA interferase toxin, RelE/StbE family [Pseudomonas prosekii]RLU13402.1 type II toxin-antitoxin system mRNA interferase toxin, RelE/StbE family [Pseudomonas prosekii]TWD46267.1 addiction module RelE/StbE family toxin [Pseudomonas sp. SJZ131]
MRVIWRPAALNDRDNIMNYICQDNPDAAIALDEVFELKAEQARHQPRLYRHGRISGTHEIVATPNYVMVYTVVDKNVEVLRILHARQHWP